MSRPTFETISSQLDIIIPIFNFLAFEDQLRLSGVSDNLKYVFKKYIWKQNYESLKISENRPYFGVTNDTDLNRLCINARLLLEFLRCYAVDVIKLNLEFATSVIDVRKFPNVTSLQYHSVTVPRDQLKRVADFFPNLQELRLMDCSFADALYNLLQDITSQMGNLKKLIIQHREPGFGIQHTQYHEIMEKIQLECIKLTAAIDPDDSKENANNSSVSHLHLKELSLSAACDIKYWSNTSYPLFLRNFEFLSILTIYILDPVTDEVLKTFAKACQNLEVFNIQFSNFTDVQMICLPPKVRELSLYCCTGVSYNNAQQIIAESKVRKFHSENEYPSVHMEPDEGRVNLKKLAWYPRLNNNSDVTFNELESCFNLHVLDVNDFYLPLDIVLKMKSLHKLAMPHPRIKLAMPHPSVSWPYITSVLRHPPLDELIIHGSGICFDNQYLLSDIPRVGFATNVKNLEIPLDIFEVAIDFWLDIYSKNTNLKRICCTFDYAAKLSCFPFLWRIIQHANFPRSVKTMNICGIVQDCSELRRDPGILSKLRKKMIDGEYNVSDHIIFEKNS